MHAMPGHHAGGRHHLVGARFAAVCIVTALGGCASSIQTPLPDLPKSHVSSSMSQQDRQKAVDELQKAGATHEQAAEEQIESSR